MQPPGTQPGCLPRATHPDFVTGRLRPFSWFDFLTFLHTEQCQTLWFLSQNGCILPDKLSIETSFWKSLLPKPALTWVPSHIPTSLWLSSGDGSISALGGFIHTDEPFYTKTSWKNCWNTLSPHSHFLHSLAPASVRHLVFTTLLKPVLSGSRWPSCLQIQWWILVLIGLCSWQCLTQFIFFTWPGLPDTRFLAFFLTHRHALSFLC